MYIYIHPSMSEVILEEKYRKNIIGIFISPQEEYREAFSVVNEYKVKYSSSFTLGTFGEFNQTYNRYYYDNIIFMARTSNTTELLKEVKIELMKGKSFVGFETNDFLSYEVMLETMNYIDTFCEQDKNYAGYVLFESPFEQ